MGKALMVDSNKCIGCKACELACSFKHHQKYVPSKARIKVCSPEEAFFVPVFCSQCSQPLCQGACRFEAIKAEEVDGTWIVKILPDKCIGCKKCVAACPFGAINYLNEEKSVQKCDLCDGDPECIKFCIRGALVFAEEEEVSRAKQTTFAAKVLQKLHEETGE